VSGALFLTLELVSQQAIHSASAAARKAFSSQIWRLPRVGGGVNASNLAVARLKRFSNPIYSDALWVELRPWGISVSIAQLADIRTPARQMGLTAADKMLTSSLIWNHLRL